jgi:diketogulonate reductase-like aldo/keto reductase
MEGHVGGAQLVGGINCGDEAYDFGVPDWNDDKAGELTDSILPCGFDVIVDQGHPYLFAMNADHIPDFCRRHHILYHFYRTFLSETDILQPGLYKFIGEKGEEVKRQVFWESGF